MAFDEEMFALGKSKDWKACHRRIDEEAPGATREQRVSVALWRAIIYKWEKRYSEALRILEGIRDEVYTSLRLCITTARIIHCPMGEFSDAIDTLRGAPFCSELDTFPAVTYEAIFLYCYLLAKSGQHPPPNLLAALPDDFRTMLYDRRSDRRKRTFL